MLLLFFCTGTNVKPHHVTTGAPFQKRREASDLTGYEVSEENRGRNRYNVEMFLCAYYISAGQTSLLQVQWKLCIGIIFIVPEEGWFGQPKYSTHIKTFLRCTGFCLYFLHFIYVKPVRSPLIQRTPAGSSFRLLAQTFYEVSAATWNGVCILAYIFREIGYLWPLFLYQIEIDAICLILLLCPLSTLQTGSFIWGTEEEWGEEKSLFLQTILSMRFTLFIVPPFPENFWII